jgi:hypothetical protein
MAPPSHLHQRNGSLPCAGRRFIRIREARLYWPVAIIAPILLGKSEILLYRARQAGGYSIQLVTADRRNWLAPAWATLQRGVENKELFTAFDISWHCRTRGAKPTSATGQRRLTAALFFMAAYQGKADSVPIDRGRSRMALRHSFMSPRPSPGRRGMSSRVSRPLAPGRDIDSFLVARGAAGALHLRTSAIR